MAASTSAVCLGALFWPSILISLMPPSALPSAMSCFCMCTKKGNSRLGKEVAIVSSFFAWAKTEREPASRAMPARPELARSVRRSMLNDMDLSLGANRRDIRDLGIFVEYSLGSAKFAAETGESRVLEQRSCRRGTVVGEQPTILHAQYRHHLRLSASVSNSAVHLVSVRYRRAAQIRNKPRDH